MPKVDQRYNIRQTMLPLQNQKAKVIYVSSLFKGIKKCPNIQDLLQHAQNASTNLSTTNALACTFSGTFHFSEYLLP